MRTKEVIYEVGLHTYKLIYNLSKGFAKLYCFVPSFRPYNGGRWFLLELFEDNKRENYIMVIKRHYNNENKNFKKYRVSVS